MSGQLRAHTQERYELETDASRIERFRDVYDKTYPRISAYVLRRSRNRDDALDAVSETFMVVWRRLEDMPTGGREVAWVYGVARRVLANQYRSRDRVARLTARLKENLVADGHQQPSELVRQALDALSTIDRDILTMVAWDDLTNSEIGAILGRTEKYVAVRLHRARKRLAAELSRLGLHGNPDSGAVKSMGRSRTHKEVKGTDPTAAELENP